MYKNRKTIGNFWPIPRKGTKYLSVSLHNKRNSIPLVVVMRDILKLIRTKKELKKAINEKQIAINGKEIKDTNYPLGLFDILTLKKLKKNYRVELGENGKFVFIEVHDNEATSKTIKVIGKKVIGKNKIQLNLADGSNILSNEKLNLEDSVLINFKDKKIDKIFKMEKGNYGYVFKGKHIGTNGKIVDVIERGGKKLAVIDHGEKVRVWVKNVIVIGGKK